MNLKPISGDRVDLTPFQEAHITDEYLSWLNNKLMMQYSRQKHFTHTKETSLTYLEGFAGTPHFFWAIIERSSGQHIGTINAYVDTHHLTADIGLLIGARSAHGRGFGQEAWCLAMDYLFCEHSLRKITGGTNSENKAMVSIMETSDMILEGRRKDQEIVDGNLTDIVLYAKFNPNGAPLTNNA